MVDDLVAMVDDEGAVMATDETIPLRHQMERSSWMTSVADDDGNLVPVAKKRSIDAPGESPDAS